jgi:adenylate cyclase
LYRLRGELLLAMGAEIHDAEAALLRANEIAREQRAKALELRAATSLAKLWVRQRREIEARQVLSAIVSWFTEGFDTPDFLEAQALLARLQ